MIESVKVDGKILIVEYADFRDMRLSAWRISDFYEGVDAVKGKCFSIHEYLDAYLSEDCELRTWNFWEGYNFPKSVLLNFEGKFFKDITAREQRLIAMSNRIPDDGYVILYKSGDEVTMKHEIAHAYYFTDAEYRNKANEVVRSIPTDIFGKFADCLKLLDYIPEVFNDEIQAYLTAYDQDEFDECFKGITWDDIKEYSEKLNELYNGKVSHS